MVMEGIEKIGWRDRVSNQDVLIKVDERRCLMRTIWQIKKNWISHVLRENGLLKDVLEGRMLRKRRGIQRTLMLNDLMRKSKPKRKK